MRLHYAMCVSVEENALTLASLASYMLGWRGVPELELQKRCYIVEELVLWPALSRHRRRVLPLAALLCA